MRVVVDTNVLASALIRPQGVTGQVLAFLRGNRFTIVYSVPLLVELVDVLGRPHIQKKYGIRSEDITALVLLIRLKGDLINPTSKIEICRDPEDNMVIATALDGSADAIVSGDADLLSLKEFKAIPILRVAEFLLRV